MTSHAYILYLVAVKPYQTYGINSYVLANETFYSALIIAIFIFSDATPELNIKYGAGICLMTSLVLLVLANVVTNIAYMILGHDKLKKQIKDQKLKRAEKEALERAEEEERRLKQKKEEEEFTKLPDDTQNMSQSQLDQNQSSNAANTLTDLNTKSEKKHRKGKDGKDKSRKGDDNVSEAQFGSVVNKGDDSMSDLPATKKKRRREKDKQNNKDDVTEGTIGEVDKEKKKKSRRHKDLDTVPQTDFGTNPTQKDFL